MGNVSWNDAQAFAAWLGRKEGNPYRLPTEAEWEYACRAGTTSLWSIGDDEEDLAAVGNISDGTAKEKYSDRPGLVARDGYIFTAPVGRFRQNAFGLFDMHGNVWEWCSDGYDADYYKWSPMHDPPGPVGTTFRISRGGSWADASRFCRSADRWISPEQRGAGTGFRVALGVLIAQPSFEAVVGPAPEARHAAEKQPLQKEAKKVAPGDQIKQTQQTQMQMLQGARGQNQVLLGKATFLPTFTCNKCGASIRQFPMAVDFADLKPLEDNCRVHLQSSRWKNGQETGKLDRTEFIWMASGNTSRSPIVDVREIVKANDPRSNNKSEWAHVFIFTHYVFRSGGFYPLTSREMAAERDRDPSRQVLL